MRGKEDASWEDGPAPEDEEDGERGKEYVRIPLGSLQGRGPRIRVEVQALALQRHGALDADLGKSSLWQVVPRQPGSVLLGAGAAGGACLGISRHGPTTRRTHGHQGGRRRGGGLLVAAMAAGAARPPPSEARGGASMPGCVVSARSGLRGGFTRAPDDPPPVLCSDFTDSNGPLPIVTDTDGTGGTGVMESPAPATAGSAPPSPFPPVSVALLAPPPSSERVLSASARGPHSHQLVHVQEAGSGQDVLHRRRLVQLQHAFVEEVQQQAEGGRRDDVAVERDGAAAGVSPEDPRRVGVEHVEEGRAGGQNRLVSQEPGRAHHHGAVAQEAALALGAQSGQQLLGVLGELHRLEQSRHNVKRLRQTDDAHVNSGYVGGHVQSEAGVLVN
ncbi:hypothetical protein EYF80_049686 [Liparis tanakae]|uniref:Uncharacterized protein n=1 Tax=Liparis tanakae TaxID=230148 RepID=A0A4Z2FH96_9TELE|nr:hypothetical protein EYF80_049686 [Liparis tanakae]